MSVLLLLLFRPVIFVVVAVTVAAAVGVAVAAAVIATTDGNLSYGHSCVSLMSVLIAAGIAVKLFNNNNISINDNNNNICYDTSVNMIVYLFVFSKYMSVCLYVYMYICIYLRMYTCMFSIADAFI